MKRARIACLLAVMFATWGEQHKAICAEPDLPSLLDAFRDYCGAELVFRRDDLPPGRYHDILQPLDETRKTRAAEICLAEAKLYPPHYFAELGLKTIGVFAACVSKSTTDESRTFDRQLGGYRYFGIYNGNDAIATSFYSDGQLGLTFHHEVFHHVDSTVRGNTAAWQLSSDDAFYAAAISLRKPYPAPAIEPDDLKQLRQKCIGYTLKDAVSQYAAKNPREDQAETARHFMTMLPNSLVQIIDEPNLPGSQRILHLCREYETSVIDGPNIDWFVDVALGRAKRADNRMSIDALLQNLRQIPDPSDRRSIGIHFDPSNVRQLMKTVLRAESNDATEDEANEIVKRSANLTVTLLRNRIRPDQANQRFDIWGHEDHKGVNHTLRHDLVTFGRDIQRFAWIAENWSPRCELASTHFLHAASENLQTLHDYQAFIARNFTLTNGTDRAFDSARKTIIDSMARFARPSDSEIH